MSFRHCCLGWHLKPQLILSESSITLMIMQSMPLQLPFCFLVRTETETVWLWMIINFTKSPSLVGSSVQSIFTAKHESSLWFRVRVESQVFEGQESSRREYLISSPSQVMLRGFHMAFFSPSSSQNHEDCDLPTAGDHRLSDFKSAITWVDHPLWFNNEEVENEENQRIMTLNCKMSK